MEKCSNLAENLCLKEFLNGIGGFAFGLMKFSYNTAFKSAKMCGKTNHKRVSEVNIEAVLRS